MTTRSKNPSLSRFVRTRRRVLRLTAYEAARRAGLHRSYWSKLEAGEYTAPKPQSLRAVADALQVPVDDLYELVGYDLPQQLPSLRPYLRARYQLPHNAVVDLERYFDFLRSHYGIPKHKPVFPPKPLTKTNPSARQQTQPKRAA